MTLVQPDIGSSSLVIPVERKEMLTLRTCPESGRTIIKINSSSLSIVQECLRKAQYSLYQGWRTDNESAALVFGKAVHKAMEIYYAGEPEERILPKFEHLEMMAYGHAPPKTNNDLIFRSVQGFLDVARPLASLPEGDKRSLYNGVYILFEYFKKFIDDPYVAYRDEHGRPYVEKTFTYRFDENPAFILEIFGTIDIVLKNVTTGEILPADHKTTSSLGYGDSSYYDRDKPNHQYTMYMLGVNRVLGLPCEDFLVNVIEVKGKPKTPRGSGPNFPRQITKRTEEDYEELRDVLWKVAMDYVGAMAEGVWPMGGVDACNKYGGCGFKQICGSPRSLRETLLRNKFIKGDTLEAK